jgi:hypothetical protein
MVFCLSTTLSGAGVGGGGGVENAPPLIINYSGQVIIDYDNLTTICKPRHIHTHTLNTMAPPSFRLLGQYRKPAGPKTICQGTTVLTIL